MKTVPGIVRSHPCRIPSYGQQLCGIELRKIPTHQDATREVCNGLFPTMAFEWFGMCKPYFCGSCIFDMTDLLSRCRFYSPLLRELGLPVPLADFWRQSLFSRFRSQSRRAFTVEHGSKYDKFISGRLTFRSAML